MAIQIHQQRLERQLLGANRWKHAGETGLSHANGWGTWWWETGVGKTFATYTVANKMLEVNVSYLFLIGLPSPEIKKQWETALRSYVDPKFHANFMFYTAHELLEIAKQGKRIQCTLFVADELHEWYTEERLKFFNGTIIITRWCLGLTADFQDMAGRWKQINNILPVVDRIDTEEAVREGYISKYIEYNVAVELTEPEKEKYRLLSEQVNKNLKFFGKGGIDLANKVLSGTSTHKGFDIAMAIAVSRGWSKSMDMSNATNAEIYNMWAPGKIMGYARLAMDNIRERKTLMYHAINKLKIGRDVVIKFDTLKTICFSQSTLFADALANIINRHYTTDDNNPQLVCVVYHSKIPTQVVLDPLTGKTKKKGKTVLKREAIEAIRSGTARAISTASSLDRGFDVQDIRLALTTSGTQNPTQYNQRKGRAVRKEEEDIIVLIINLYCKGTIDEHWLRRRQSKIKSVVYWVDTIDDINYTPKRKDVFNLNEI